jgi:hypothetical protein
MVKKYLLSTNPPARVGVKGVCNFTRGNQDYVRQAIVCDEKYPVNKSPEGGVFQKCRAIARGIEFIDS